MMNEVVMVKNMEKDGKIERSFERYFDGAPLPPCDLSEAKRVVSARARKRRRKLTAAIGSIVAACACALIISAVFLFRALAGLWGGPLPDGSYLLSETSSIEKSFSELNGKYDLVHSLAPFSLSDNSSAQYTLYYAHDREVLLRADLRYADNYSSFRATVWCDLTGGELSTKDFEDYRALIPEGETYGSDTVFMNGEYVSRACMLKGGTEYVIDMTSPQKGSLNKLVSMLKK